MSHAEGAYLGGARTSEDVMGRCVIDADTGCWHLRTARGKPQKKGRTSRIWIHGRGQVSATRAVWELTHAGKLPAHRRAVRMCESFDCANPAHIKALTHSEFQRHVIGGWHDMTPARQANLLRIARARRRFTPEQVAEIRHSTLSVAAMARKLGCSRCAVQDIRKGRTYRDPVASVWGLAA